MRILSGASDFPTRSDATKAREIAVQLVDPLDPPEALPLNLPFPQLQTAATSGMRTSPSNNSVKTLGGIFSAIGRRSSGKKGKELPAYSQILSTVADSVPKRSVDMSAINRQTSIPSPVGPRNRNSISGMDHRSSARLSTDRPVSSSRLSMDRSARNSISSVRRDSESRTGFMSKGAGGVVRKEDVIHMREVLPAADPAVLELYLARQGSQMAAIG